MQDMLGMQVHGLARLPLKRLRSILLFKKAVRQDVNLIADTLSVSPVGLSISEAVSLETHQNAKCKRILRAHPERALGVILIFI